MSEQLNLFDDLSFYEGPDVEYKAGKGGLPSDLWETYSAFANSQGGVIWLGISQKSGRLDIHGVPNPEKLVSDFWNTINNRGKVNTNLLTNSDVSIVPIADQAPVVRISVPHADRRQKPVFVGNDPFRGTFRRNYEGDYRCTEAEVRRMFPIIVYCFDKNGTHLADAEIRKLVKWFFYSQVRARYVSQLSRQTVCDFERGAVEDLGIVKVERLLNLVGLSLEARPVRQRLKDWLALAARSAGVRYSNPPTKAQLGEMLASGNAETQWKTHVRQVLEEFPAVAFPGLVQQLGSEYGIGTRKAWRNLEKLAKSLECHRIGSGIGT